MDWGMIITMNTVDEEDELEDMMLVNNDHLLRSIHNSCHSITSCACGEKFSHVEKFQIRRKNHEFKWKSYVFLCGKLYI